MSKLWKILPKHSDDLRTQLLINRGLKTREEIDKFFNPNLEDFEKDLKIAGISVAHKRIQKAIQNQEQIIIFGDYDVDGIASCAILYKALTSIGAKVLPYIPHREKEGYGLSNTGLEFARDSGASLVITVDNGIVAIDQAKYAKEIGLDLIITDHHLPLKEKPDAFAIVHSTKMCGGGVAWCLVRDLIKEDLAKELLEFVAIATVCDLIPLTGLGRVFVKEGLKILNRTRNLGLLSLFEECSIVPGRIGSYEIGHMIGPRINAIGRLEHAIDALRLLCTKDQTKAKKLAKLLCEANTTRQELTTIAVEEAKILVSKEKDKKIHIIQSKNWAPGIIGLIAARVTEEHFKPAIALSVGETFAKGSARSINGINIVEVIRKVSDILIDVGGHSGAAGFTIPNEKIEIFKERIELVMQEMPDGVEPYLEIDAEVESRKLTKSLVEELSDFEPFGFGNPRPILATRLMKISDIRTVGNGKHLKFKVSPSVIQRESEGSIDCIAFGMGDLKDLLSNGQLIDVAYFLEINEFNGARNLQLKVKDIKLAS